MVQKRVLLLFGSLFLFLIGCGIEETYKTDDAFLQLYMATEYRKQRCGSAPSYRLFPLEEPSKFSVDACVFSLMREPCPFTLFPAVCLEVFGVDVPGIGPKP